MDLGNLVLLSVGIICALGCVLPMVLLAVCIFFDL